MTHDSWLRKYWPWLVGGGAAVAVGGVLFYSKQAYAAPPVIAPTETIAVTLVADNQSVHVPTSGSLGIYVPAGGAITAITEDNKPVAVANGSTKFVVTSVRVGGMLQISWMDSTGTAHVTNLSVSTI